MITSKDSYFSLHTKHTSYAFHVLPTGQLEHLYYGKKISGDYLDQIVEQKAFAPGNSVIYDQEHPQYSLEDMCLEFSTYGRGDIHEPYVECISSDGSNTLDFQYESFTIRHGKEALEGLPSSYDEMQDVEQLVITCKDRNNGYVLELTYSVFEDCDVITRSARFINTSDTKVRLTRLLSGQIDFHESGLQMTTFNGAWIKEMTKYTTTVFIGKFVNSSYAGTSSSRANPFVMIHPSTTSELQGDVYGCNLIYSGNHYEALEATSFGKSRYVWGINPTNFGFVLESGESFQAPEAVMTYSSDGFQAMSHNMHTFVQEHIVRGVWKKKERPVLLNSWEASYFNISESSLLRLAKKGKEVGIELFVMDDGWFGNRNDDLRALGDWTENTKKLPHGIKGLCDKINALGMDFGIWIEPEMVNVDSDLYRKHPEWTIEIPGKHHAEGRNQRILDFCNPDVVQYMSEAMISVLSSANIAYVKWDMNRIFSDYFSQYLSPDHQQEVAHRYVLGFYQLAKTLTEHFPNILFEGCSSGGNRFDLGMLCYFPQIWGSDNTDAVSRLSIQNGYSYGYPMSTIGAHVSAVPNHQTLRVTPLESRFAVASFGVLGYECNLCDLPKEELDEIAKQIAIYKAYRSVMQFGDFYRIQDGNLYQWMVVSKDQSKAIGMIMQKEAKPNAVFTKFAARGLDAGKLYHFYNVPKKVNITMLGDLINTATPIHVKQGSLLHSIVCKVVKLDGEKEDYVVDGETLMHGGIHLKQAYGATGTSGDVRQFTDYASRMYFMEEAE